MWQNKDLGTLLVWFLTHISLAFNGYSESASLKCELVEIRSGFLRFSIPYHAEKAIVAIENYRSGFILPKVRRLPDR
jgi:hypothetical protein